MTISCHAGHYSCSQGSDFYDISPLTALSIIFLSLPPLSFSLWRLYVYVCVNNKEKEAVNLRVGSIVKEINTQKTLKKNKQETKKCIVLISFCQPDPNWSNLGRRNLSRGIASNTLACEHVCETIYPVPTYIFLSWVPALVSLSDKLLWSESANQINSFFSKFLLVRFFLAQ